MRRTWWIWSFLIGLSAAGVIGWRVLNQRYEINRKLTSEQIRSIEDAKSTVKPGESSYIGLKYLEFADRINAELQAEGKVHKDNVATYTFWEGWARYRSGHEFINEAFGNEELTADPNPESYIEGWELIEDAIKSGNLDVPNVEGKAFKRFEKLTEDQFKSIEVSEEEAEQGITESQKLAKAQDTFAKEGIAWIEKQEDLFKKYGIEAVKGEDGNLVALSADPDALQQVGISVRAKDGTTMPVKEVATGGTASSESPESPADSGGASPDERESGASKAPLNEWQIGKPISDAQIAFLANRDRVHREIDNVYLKLAHRFLDLERPEYAWQFLSVVAQDRSVANGAYLLHSLLRRAADAKFEHIKKLAEFMRDPDALKAEENLLQARQTYDDALTHFRNELDTAVRSAYTVQNSVRMQIIDENYERESKKLEQKRTEIAEREIREGGSEEKDLSDFEIESRRQEQEFLKKLERRVAALYDAINSIKQLRRSLRFALDDLGNNVPLLPADEIVDLMLSDNSLLRQVALDAPSTLGEKEREQFNQALRGLALIDLNLLRGRAARLQGDGRSAAQRFSDNDSELDSIVNQVKLLREQIDSVLEPFKKDPLLQNLGGNEEESKLDDMGKNLLYVEKGIEKLRNIVQTSALLNSQDRRRYRVLEKELARIKKSLQESSFELAELKYQTVLYQLRLLTSEDRPPVTYRAAKAYGEEHRDYIDQMEDWLKLPEEERGVRPTSPFSKFQRSSNAERKQLAVWISREMKYRELRDDAIHAFEQFIDNADSDIAQRAKFGIASLQLDDMLFEFDWKWNQGFDVSSPNSEGDAYGVFAWIDRRPFEEYPEAFEENEGYWLDSQSALERFSQGPDSTRIDQVEEYLSELRESASPSGDPDLYIAIWLRSGQLEEFKDLPPFRDRGVQAMRFKQQYLGDLPKAISDFYIPVLQTKIAISPRAFTENRYIPLREHFNRVRSKLDRWMINVDLTNPASIEALFAAISPPGEDESYDADGVSNFYVQYFRALQSRDPGLVDLPYATYDFNYRVGELAEARGRLLLNSENGNAGEIRRLASETQELARTYFRRSGDVFYEFDRNFDIADGKADRALKTGDAYFRAKEYLRSIEAFRSYLELRRKTDEEKSKPEPYFVANRIGEAYMQLGIYEGNKMREALAKNDETSIQRELTPETLTIDGAIPAFRWVISKSRSLLNEQGEGGFVQNNLPPGALVAYVNMAKAHVELGRLVMGGNETEGRTLLQRAIDLIESDFLNPGVFPFPADGFSDTLVYRDAQFYVGTAELELAKAERLKPKDQMDSVEFERRLRRASDALDEIVGRWRDPVDREIYRMVVEQKRVYSEAKAEAGSSRTGKFFDDIYYITIFQQAEIDWLRAVHNPDPDSQVVIDALDSAEGRLQFLQKKFELLTGDQSRSVLDEALTFPELRRQVDFMLGDVIYLNARTLRNRLQSNVRTIRKLDVRDLYANSISAYDRARAAHPHSYLTAWAYTQQLNAHRALADPNLSEPDESAEHKRLTIRMLDASGTFMNGLPDEAFTDAPTGMTRADFENFFAWFRRFSPLVEPANTPSNN